MFQKFTKALKKKNNKKGFTLVELMVVVLIIGILCIIAIPIYNSVQLSAKEKVHDSNLRLIDTAVEQYKLEHNDGLPYNIDELKQYFKSGRIPSVPEGLPGIRDSFYYLRDEQGTKLASPLGVGNWTNAYDNTVVTSTP